MVVGGLRCRFWRVSLCNAARAFHHDELPGALRAILGSQRPACQRIHIPLAAIPSAVLAVGPSECISSDPGHHRATLPRACPTNGSDRGKRDLPLIIRQAPGEPLGGTGGRATANTFCEVVVAEGVVRLLGAPHEQRVAHPLVTVGQVAQFGR